MGPRLAQVLKDHRTKQNEARLKVGPAWSNNDLVFCRNNGSPLNGDKFYYREFKPILKKAGLRSIRLHDLRHTFATLLIAQGENVKFIQRQMGHASIQTTLDRYGHLLNEQSSCSGSKLDGQVFGGVSNDGQMNIALSADVGVRQHLTEAVPMQVNDENQITGAINEHHAYV